MAADGLTAKRSAALRIELPSARSRRSRDNGAVMVSSPALTPGTLESERPMPCNPELL
jgi:hypothetical protein